MNPYLFTGLKNSLVAIILVSVLIIGHKWSDLRKLSLQSWSKLLLIGIIGGGIPFLLFFKGLTLTSAVQGSFIHKNMFLIVAMIAPFILKEKLNRSIFVGTILLLLGNVLLLNKAFPFQFNLGNLLIIMATTLWALENIVSKQLLSKIEPQIVAASRMVFGSIFISLYLVLSGQWSMVSDFNNNSWIWIGITSLFLFGYVFTWYHGLQKIPVTIATSVLALGSPITTVLTLIYGQKLSFFDITGTIVILTGVLVLIEIPKLILSNKHNLNESITS